MLGFDVESGKDIRWKVRQVQRDDQARMRVNRGGEDVPIVVIRQTQGVSEVLVSTTTAPGNACSIRRRVRSNLSRVISGRFLS